MITYILQTSICLFGFYVLYLLFLKKETFFSVNRWYLLATLSGSLMIPFLPLLLKGSEAPEFAAGIQPVAITVQGFVQTFEKPAWYAFHWTDLLLAAYLLGLVIHAIRFISGLRDIYALYRGAAISRIGKLTLARTRNPHLPFSFFRVLFIYEDYQISESDLQKIIRHEQAHANQWHSIDVLFVELSLILLWLNPVIYFYRKSLREVHEYLADAAVLQSAPVGKYGRLLLTQSQSGLQMALTNQFFQSQLKNRIQMMTRKRSSQWAGLKYLALIPILLIVVGLFSFRNSGQVPGGEIPAPVPGAADTLPATLQKAGNKAGLEEMVVVGYRADTLPVKDQKAPAETLPALADVDQMPRFSGCEEIEDEKARQECSTKLLMQQIYTQIRYPKEAREAGIQGRVVAAFTVNEAGRVEGTRILQGLGYGMDEEVLRVISDLNSKEPPFVPGTRNGQAVPVELTFPVQFRLEAKDGQKNSGKPEKVRIKPPNGESPVYVVDGVKTSQVGIEEIDPNTIQSIDVIKSPSDEELEKFGPEAENGIIYITSRVPGNPERAEGTSKTFKVVEEMPRFPGCEDSGLEGHELTNCANGKLVGHIAAELEYPAEARTRLIEGMVVARFVVMKDGSIGDIRILKSPGGGTDQAVVDVLESMNRMEERWIPGKQRGSEVNVEMTIPVKFKLSTEEAGKAKTRIDQLPVTLELEGFQVAPNPSDGIFEVSFSNSSREPVAVHVFDMQGAQLHSQLFEPASGTVSTRIDLGNAPSGQFVLMIIQGGERFTTRIQKQ